MQSYLEDPVLNLTSAALRILRWGALTLAAMALCAVMLIALTLAMPDVKIFETAAERGTIMVVMPTAMAMGYILARFLKALQEIVLSVRQGHPLSFVNAGRLRSMGWLMLALQATTLMSIFALNLFGKQWEFDTIDAVFGLVESILIAASLFILARVFDHGARMHEELEGTV